MSSGGASKQATATTANNHNAVAAAVCLACFSCLQDAVVAGHLKSATYQRLMLAILGKNCLYLAAFALVSRLHSSSCKSACYSGGSKESN
jgi:hypothetical protein